jgi:hypothetical protein
MKCNRKQWLKSSLIGISACMVVGIYLSSAAATISVCDSSSAAFNASDNSQQKIGILRNLAAKNECQGVLLKVILKALSDKRSSVVEEAILWAGNNKVAAAAPALLDLYQNAGRKYPGSQPKLEGRIIMALGSIDSKETRDLFAQLLSAGNIDVNMDKLLSSISASCGHDVLPQLKSFSGKLNEILSTMQHAPENAYRYAQCKKLLSKAESIINNDSSR